MTNALTTRTQNESMLVVADRRNERITLRLFAAWLNKHDLLWSEPDLHAWRNALLTEGKQPSTVQTYIRQVQRRYRDIIKSDDLKQWVYSQLPRDLSLAEKRAYLAEVQEQLTSATSTVKVKTQAVQDAPDAVGQRLSIEQQQRLLECPGLDDLLGWRDTLMIALMLGTGARETEICNIRVEHIRQTYDGQVALQIPHGKGDKQRMVPWGEFEWVLSLADGWMARAGVENGYLLRGIHSSGQTAFKTGIKRHTVICRLANYPIRINGKDTTVKPHDLRRTYAKTCHANGMSVEAIAKNLGHARLETTLGYLGGLDAAQRQPSGTLPRLRV